MKNSPLAGLRVVELASVLAGPRVGQFFAEWGSQVIKIENPTTGGDVTRSWKLPTEDPQETRSAYFASCNWGKQNLLLDFRQGQDIARAHELIASADIVLTSYKSGDAEKWKMDYPTLRNLNPKLIYGAIRGYPEPDSRVGYDAILQAEAGFTFMNGEATGKPVKMPVALVDVLTAHQLREALLIALLRREQEGVGAFVSVSLFESAVASLANQATNFLVGDHIPQRMGSQHPNIVPYGTLFQTQNIGIVLAVGSDGQFARLADLLGHPEWAADPRFSTNASRVRHRQTLNAQLETAFARQDGKALLKNLKTAKVPAGELRDMQMVFDDPNTAHIRLSGDGLEGLRSSVARLDGNLPDFHLSPPPKLRTEAPQTKPDA